MSVPEMLWVFYEFQCQWTYLLESIKPLLLLPSWEENLMEAGVYLPYLSSLPASSLCPRAQAFLKFMGNQGSILQGMKQKFFASNLMSRRAQ